MKKWIGGAPLGSLEAALEELNRMIRSGHEFPDAAWAAAQNHKVSQQELEAAWDAQFK